VKRSHFLTAAVVACLLVAGPILSGVWAQTRTAGAPARYTPRPAPGSIALVDIGKVFKQHARFNQAMAAMKAKVQQAESQLQKDMEALKQWVEEMKKFKKGSTEYNEWERRITERRSEINVQMQLTRKEFLQEEARIYHQIYREIEYHVGQWAAQNGVSIVLRFNSDQPDASNPEDVLQFINKPVVWHSPAVDITNQIINTLNARSGGAYQRADRRPAVPYPPQRR